MASFTAGHFYDISGRMDGISGERHHAMYVADEGNMHVFASATDKGILMRVKVHEGDINSVNGPDIEVNSGQTRIIVFPRPERAESVNRFVDRAYGLAGVDGPNAHTLQEDVYAMMDKTGMEHESARLRTIIQSYKD